MDANPCMACGACCVAFRVSFYWREADDATPGGVPADLCDDLNQFYRVMRGTNSIKLRCAALQGQAGIAVYCAIYERRASVCRAFAISWENGAPNELCDAARRAIGLQPLTPEDHGGTARHPLIPQCDTAKSG